MDKQTFQVNHCTGEYSTPEFSGLIAKEPTVEYGVKSEIRFEEEFNQALATAITGDELREYMHTVIRSWPWKEK